MSLTLGAHARGLRYLVCACLSVSLSVVPMASVQSWETWALSALFKSYAPIIVMPHLPILVGGGGMGGDLTYYKSMAPPMGVLGVVKSSIIAHIPQYLTLNYVTSCEPRTPFTDYC